ncbi:MAG: SDR family oxidoreductase [Anaerolineae bacterium]|nr:SDR family oxidoreductase [Anaerolineae bacterium]
MMHNNERFKDQVAVITGGAQGLGEAFARRFASEGACIVIIDLQCEKCEQLAAQLHREHGVQALAVSVNVADHDAVQRAVADVVQHTGRVDIWVNNAGIYRGTPLEQLSMDGMEFDARSELHRRVHLHQGHRAGDETATLRTHHQHEQHRRPHRLQEQRRLLQQQSCRHRPDPRDGHGPGPIRRDGERRVPRLDPHRHAAQGRCGNLSQ